jgi:hypothetical protein
VSRNVPAVRAVEAERGVAAPVEDEAARGCPRPAVGRQADPVPHVVLPAQSDTRSQRAQVSSAVLRGRQLDQHPREAEAAFVGVSSQTPLERVGIGVLDDRAFLSEIASKSRADTDREDRLGCFARAVHTHSSRRFLLSAAVADKGNRALCDLGVDRLAHTGMFYWHTESEPQSRTVTQRGTKRLAGWRGMQRMPERGRWPVRAVWPRARQAQRSE